MRSARVKSSRRTMRMRSVTSWCTLAISALPAALTSVAWKASSSSPTSRASLGAQRRRHQPHRLQRLQRRRVLVPRHQLGDGVQLEHHAQVVELVELAEVDRLDEPAGLGLHVQEAFVAQPEQRLAHRRARHADALADLGFGEAVAGHPGEVVQLGLELRIDLLGQVGALRRRGVRGRKTHLRIMRQSGRPLPVRPGAAAAAPRARSGPRPAGSGRGSGTHAPAGRSGWRPRP